MASKDAFITAADLMRAGQEVFNRPLPETASRLRELEPALIGWIDAWADKTVGRMIMNGARTEDAQYVAAEMRRIGYATIRAMQTANYRLWANVFLEDERNDDGKQ